jgi:hypothetical protein
MDLDPGPLPPATLGELARHGWIMIAKALTRATTEDALVAHWFLTPDDASVHIDDQFGGNDRTATFLRVVVPTLADQLDASSLWVAAPWDLETTKPLMALLVGIRGQQPMLEARAVSRHPDPTAGPPWWVVDNIPLEPPAELAELAAKMQL